jgi:hypothetical protein
MDRLLSLLYQRENQPENNQSESDCPMIGHSREPRLPECLQCKLDTHTPMVSYFRDTMSHRLPFVEDTTEGPTIVIHVERSKHPKVLPDVFTMEL